MNEPTLTYFNRSNEEDFDRVISVNGPTNDNGEITTVILYEGDDIHNNRSVLVAVNKSVAMEESYEIMGFHTEMSVDIVVGEIVYKNNTIIISNKTEGVDDIIEDRFSNLDILTAIITNTDSYFEHMRDEIVKYISHGNITKVKFINIDTINPDRILYNTAFTDDLGETRDVYILKMSHNSFDIAISKTEDDIDAEGNRIVSDTKSYITSANFENIGGEWKVTRYIVADQLLNAKCNNQNIVDMLLYNKGYEDFRKKYNIQGVI